MPERHAPPQVEHPIVTGAREGELVDPRPRERRRTGMALGSAAAGAVIGAIVVVVIVWIVGLLSSGGFSAWVYLVAALLGAAAGPVLVPYIALSRDDGTDAAIVADRGVAGKADAPAEGGQRADRRRFRAQR